MNRILNRKSFAFTLIETLAALTVGSMVLVVALAVYSRAQAGAADVVGKLERRRLPQEVLHRIAEDLDRAAGSGQEARISVENKFQDGLSVAKMEILRFVNDAKEQPQPLEKIVWQSSIDPDTGLLTLYRSHSGMALEDTLLDAQKEPWQRELFVPICTGLTFFKIEIFQDGVLLDEWSSQNIPPAVTVTLSFAEPFKTAGGTFDVYEQDKIVRTMVVDRTRKPTFTLAPFDANQPYDANQPSDADMPSDANMLLGADVPSDVVQPVDADQPVRSRSDTLRMQPTRRIRGTTR